jgi:Domain of unknown function (DUF5642)
VRSHTVAVMAGVLASIVLAGCARSVDGTPVLPSSGAKSSRAQAAKDYDISRLSKLESDFPPGFNQVQALPVTTLGPAADSFSSVGIGQVVTVDPPQCASLLQPVRARRDAKFTMVGGVGNGAIMVGAVKSFDALPKMTVQPGCSHVAVTRTMSRRRFQSTVTRLPGPSIDGVKTTGAMDVSVKGGGESYVFTGFLSDKVAVAVQGLLPGNPHADDVLKDMLVKAVDVIRAQ